MRNLPPVPTLADLNRYEPHWLWLWCPKCQHQVAAPLAPFVIRWGANASSDALRRNARCTGCGHRGALIQMPSYSSLEEPYKPFPVESGCQANVLGSG